MEQEVFVAGSTHLFEVVIKDRIGDVAEPMSLTGATVQFRVIKPDGSVSTWSAVPDPDQVVNKGKCTYKLLTTDLAGFGPAHIQPVVTIGADVYRGKEVEHYVARQI